MKTLKKDSLYTESKTMLQKLRKKIEDASQGMHNVDKMMREKIDDYYLCEELPMSVKIGEYSIWIGTFNLDNDFKFWKEYPKLLSNVMGSCVNFEMLADGAELYKYLTTHKRLYKGLRKLIGKLILNNQEYWCNERSNPNTKVKLPKCGLRYFCKHMTKEKLIQICWMIYIYNFDAEKKNLKIILNRMTKRAPMETYMYFWLQNLVGLTGKFQLAQLINVDYWSDEKQKETIPLNGKEKAHDKVPEMSSEEIEKRLKAKNG